MQARLRVEVLARVAQRRVRGGVAVGLGGAPGGAAAVPGNGAVGGDEVGGSPGEIGDDGEEPAVALALRLGFGFALLVRAQIFR